MRRKTGNTILAVSALACFGLSMVVSNTTATADSKQPKVAQRAQMEPKEFDRLDGHGPSGKKVDVIEWEGNLEIHVYPKGGLRSLGMKIDRESKTTKNAVMVIEYGFTGVGYTMIRRAILGIPLKDGFKAYRDPSADDYDKVIISNNTLTEGVSTFALATPPTQLYPDYHPALGGDDDSGAKDTPKRLGTDEPAKTYQRKSASEGGATSEPSTPGVRFQKASEFEQDSKGTSRKRSQDSDDSDGEVKIRNFAF